MPQPSAGKVVGIILVVAIVLVALFVIFVPRIIYREEVREAHFELVSETPEVTDSWTCVDSGWFWCNRYAWVRSVSVEVKVRAIEIAGDHVVTVAVTSGLRLQGQEKSITEYIGMNEVESIRVSYDSFEVSEEEHDNAAYEFHSTVSAPKTVEKKQLTIFESLVQR